MPSNQKKKNLGKRPCLERNFSLYGNMALNQKETWGKGSSSLPWSKLFFLPQIRNALSAAITSSERPSPEPLLKKEASPAVLLEEIPGKALRAFLGSFRNFSGISSRIFLCKVFRQRCRFGLQRSTERCLFRHTLIAFQ